MARSFNNNTANRLEKTASLVGPTTYPLTISVWFNLANVTADHTLVTISDGGNKWIDLLAAGSVAGDPIRLQRSANNNGVNADTSTSYSANVWSHAAARVVSNNDSSVFLAGAGKGNNTTARTIAGLTRVEVGVFFGLAGYFTPANGSIAEVAIWTIDLTDEEIAALAGRVNPLKIRPAYLCAGSYWRLDRPAAGGEADMMGNNFLSLAGTVGLTDHAPVAPMFGTKSWRGAFTGAAATSIIPPVGGAALGGVAGRLNSGVFVPTEMNL